MRVEKNVPDIRFKRFSGEWMEHNLGELIDIRSAARVHKEQWTETGVPFFRTSDVVSIYKGQENAKAFISYDVYKELTGKIGKVSSGDLLVTGGGSIGIPFLVPNDEPLYFKDADLLWFKNDQKFDGYYLYTFLFSKAFKKYIKSISHIGTIAHYTIEQAKATPIKKCERAEQTAIGNTFQKLDNLINQHKQKHDKLSNIKKAMLEKMFPKQGETMPEIRFKGFSGEWEVMTLGEAAPLRGGFAFQSSEFFDSGIPIIKISNILATGEVGGEFNYYKEIIADENYLLLDGAALLAMSGATTGKVSILKCHHETKFYQNQRVGYFQRNTYFDYLFISTLVRSHIFRDKLDAVLVAGAQPNVSSKEIDSFKFMMPKDLEEQTAIGNYFQKLDALINQHQHQITKLTNIKQACLSKMFV